MPHVLDICRSAHGLRPTWRREDRSVDAAQILAEEFLASPFNSARYAHWPLDRQLHAFLAAGTAGAIEDYECAYTALYAKVRAGRRAATA